MHDIDVITPADVAALDGRPGPCVSLYLPGHRHGPEVRQGPVLLDNLLADVRRDLDGAGWRRRDVDVLLEPLDALRDQSEFWQHQADGLALFRAPDLTASYRLPFRVAEEAHVGDSFRVAPLVPALSQDDGFFLLALSQNEVRLFEASQHRIDEVDLADAPRSMAEALAHEDPERQLQVRSTGAGTAAFHGHGSGDEVDKAAVERYLRAVATAVDDRLRANGDRPLVLACVAYYLPIYQAASNHRTILDEPVEGSPDRRSPTELHQMAWPLVESLLATAVETEVARYREAAAAGLAAHDLGEVHAAAQEGRVELLFVSAGDHDDPRVDSAIFAALRTGARLVSTPDSLTEPAEPLAALLRF